MRTEGPTDRYDEEKSRFSQNCEKRLKGVRDMRLSQQCW
jgi:hypothetical protein